MVFVLVMILGVILEKRVIEGERQREIGCDFGEEESN